MVIWSVERAQAWYASQSSWKLGVNFIPSDAVNQIQMWQDYNATTVQRELQFAADLGYNALRVFLHDQMYQYEGKGFLDKVDAFLTTASNLGFKTILVLLEGKQTEQQQQNKTKNTLRYHYIQFLNTLIISLLCVL